MTTYFVLFYLQRKVNDKKKKELSDSEDEMFPKTEKEESGLPMFIKGTTWPMDTSVEVR